MTGKPSHAGLREYARRRTTGTHVGLYRAAEADLDDEGGAAPWATVCEEHAGVCSHATLDLARAHAPHPEQWCPVCQVWPRCSHGCAGLLRWVEDQWYCPACGDEWSTDTHPLPPEWAREYLTTAAAADPNQEGPTP